MRAVGRTPSLCPGRCCIGLEGGNRGERHGGRRARRLWRLVCAGVAIRLLAMPRAGGADWCAWLAARQCAAATAGSEVSGGGVRAVHAVVHRTPCVASSRLAAIELGHDAGGARIELSRKKICSTTIAWPQCEHTKVGAGAAGASSADSSGSGGIACNNLRTCVRLSRRLLLVSSVARRSG